MNCSEKKQIKLTEPQDPKVKANYISGYRQTYKARQKKKNEKHKTQKESNPYQLQFAFICLLSHSCCGYL